MTANTMFAQEMKNQTQQCDPKEYAVMRAYALVGRAAADFATLEFHLQFLTSFLIAGKHLSPEAVILTRRHTFADKIDMIRDFIPFRFAKGNPLRQRVLKLVTDLDSLREQRNRFVHGYWLFNWQLIFSEGLIRYSDPKWHFDKRTAEWKSMQSHDVRFGELEDLIRSIGATTHEVQGVLGKLENNSGDEQPPLPSSSPAAGSESCKT